MQSYFNRYSSVILSLLFVIASNWAVAATSYKDDGDWIKLSGTVVSSTNDAFVLDYGEGLITVEMDDWDWYEEGWSIINGDKVIVNGRIDDDLMEKRTIEAASVFVKGLNTYYFADPADEEVDQFVISYSSPPAILDGNWMSVSGTVKNIEDRTFMLNTGKGKIRVDTRTMNYNPLDDVGYQIIIPGDRVSVSGKLDLDLFEKQEIEASTIITLKKDSRGNNQ